METTASYTCRKLVCHSTTSIILSFYNNNNDNNIRLPNYDDQSTGYIVTVTLGAAVNISWQVTLRYSKFLEFYQDVCREASKAKVDIEIIQNKFPQDRLSNWLKGMTDDVRNKRKTALDSWLRELFATPVHFYYHYYFYYHYNIFFS